MSKNGRVVLGTAGIIAVILIIALSGGQDSGEVRRNPAAAEETGVPELSEDARWMATDTISQYDEVIDAAISQEGAKLSLALIVRNGTPERRAKELGDNFVRLVKTYSPDDTPGKEIGQGLYDYVVGVRSIDGDDIAMGAKVATSPRITW